MILRLSQPSLAGVGAGAELGNTYSMEKKKHFKHETNYFKDKTDKVKVKESHKNVCGGDNFCRHWEGGGKEQP